MANIQNFNAAAIDISSKDHYVAVPKDRDKQNIRRFESFTRDLHQLARWLERCQIETVAMESTGVYWYDLYTILLDYGFEVYLVNAHHVKNVPGRKSDVNDAQWLQELHSYGLLKGSFQPENLTRTLRNYVRKRKDIVEQMGQQTQKMQKALEQMNLKLNNAIRDINGKTGEAIIKAILEGERDPEKLAELRDYRIKASRETIVKSLEGNWREDQLFNLKLAWEHYHFLENHLQQCDQAIEAILDQMDQGYHPEEKLPTKRKQKNQPSFDVNKYLYKVLGVDVTNIYGVEGGNAMKIFSETGPGLKQKFPSEKEFLAWLNVVPDNKITGGKVIYSKVKKKKNKAGQAFREAANSLWRAQNPLGDYLRRKKANSANGQAVVATARKIASIYYKMVTEQVEFSGEYLWKEQQKNIRKKLNYFEKMAERLKTQLPENQEDGSAAASTVI